MFVIHLNQKHVKNQIFNDDNIVVALFKIVFPPTYKLENTVALSDVNSLASILFKPVEDKPQQLI